MNTINPILGLVQVMGEPDTGKTTFGLTTGYPVEEVAFIDDDIKGQLMADAVSRQGKKFAMYRNLVKETVGMRETELHALGLTIISELEALKPSVIFWDTWTRFENTLQPHIVKNPTAFRETYSPMGTIKGAEMWKASFDYEAQLIDRLLGCAKLVILSTHLKEHTIGNAKTGREIPDGKKPLVQKSAMRIWLRHSPTGQAPIALVLKRLGKMEIGADGVPTMVSVLPRRINPGTWANIVGYWNNPVGNRELSSDERPNDFELSILDGVLTADQKDALRLNRIEAEREKQANWEARQEEEQARIAAVNAKRTQAHELKAAGQTPKEISVALGITLPETIALIAQPA